MICNKCNNGLPDDSKFCQYCGNKIEARPSEPVNAFYNQTSQTVGNIYNVAYQQPKRVKLPKTRYCSKCGSLIDNETKKCIGCGKQYLKGIKINKYTITIGALSMAIFVSIIINIMQFNKIDDLSWKLNYYGKKSYGTTSYSGNKEYNFYKKYAVLIDKNSKKYHRYGCTDFDDSYFWIYNVAAAEQKGYTACPKCN